MREGMNGNIVCFPPESAFFIFDIIPVNSTFPYLYLDLACKQLCFPRGKGINRGNESTKLELYRAFHNSSEFFENY